jgi:hypothetical protein
VFVEVHVVVGSKVLVGSLVGAWLVGSEVIVTIRAIAEINATKKAKPATAENAT